MACGLIPMDLFYEFLSLMHKGTWWIMWPLFCIGVVAWAIGIGRFRFLRKKAQARQKFWYALENKKAPVCAGFDDAEYDALFPEIVQQKAIKQRRNAYWRFLAKSHIAANQGLSTLSALIYIAPLMGLLGTVIGMIETFKNIMQFGTNNPALMAEGISVALITTQAGLIVAFPALLLQVALKNEKEKLENSWRADHEKLCGVQ
jgi:biopolymer transport protein ExbB